MEFEALPNSYSRSDGSAMKECLVLNKDVQNSVDGSKGEVPEMQNTFQNRVWNSSTTGVADSSNSSYNESSNSSCGSIKTRTRSKLRDTEKGASTCDVPEKQNVLPRENCLIGDSILPPPKSENCNNSGTPEERPNRRRKRKSNSEESCPVCGVTVWLQELKSHYVHEVDKLTKIAKNLKKPSIEQPSINKSYELVKLNRESRVTAKVARYKKKLKNEIHCPVCDIKLTGSQDELTTHVVQCLKERRNSDSDEDMVDVDDETYEEYEWAGQVRTRTISLMEGGARALEGRIVKHKADDDDNQVLNVDSDDTLSYGQPQYSERDVILPNADENETKERNELRNAFLLDSVTQPHTLENSKWSNTNDHTSKEQTSNSETIEPDQVITCLREKIRDLEDQQNDHTKCLICMEPYTKPVVSITCWHVHCEECWLMTMGVKKLCPQCNMIVFPSDLRKIYL